MAFIKNYSCSISYFGTGTLKVDRNMLNGKYNVIKKNNYNSLLLILFGRMNVDIYKKEIELDKDIDISDIITNENTDVLDNFINQIMDNYPSSVEYLGNNLQLLKNAKSLNDKDILEQVYVKTLTDIKKYTNQSFELKPLSY